MSPDPSQVDSVFHFVLVVIGMAIIYLVMHFAIKKIMGEDKDKKDKK